MTRTGNSVSVANNTGRPALDITLNIETDAAQLFFHQVPTLEPGQRVDLSFTDFHNDEGTLFDPASATPKQIRMTGRDTLAQRYESTTLW